MNEIANEVVQELRTLRDHQEIVDCLHRYSRGIDRVDIDGDVAHVERYYLATVRERRGTTKFATGRWIDRFERRPDAWRIVVRVSTTETLVDVETADMITADARFVPWARDRSDLSYDRPLLPLRQSVKEPYRTDRTSA